MEEDCNIAFASQKTPVKSTLHSNFEVEEVLSLTLLE